MSRAACFANASLLLAALAALAAAGCSGGNAAGVLAKAPDLELKGQTKCSVAKSQSRPLIVEWPSADRGSLEAHARRGLVAVRFTGCEMEVLDACTVAGQYAYQPFTPKQDRLAVHDTDDLYANLPVGAAGLEGKLQRSGQLTVSMTLVGRYEASAGALKPELLKGECGSATHVVTGLSVGAFEFFAGADAEVGAGAHAAGTVGAGASSKASREMLAKDGDPQACAKATGDDKRPPDGCSAFLRIEVAPLPCFDGMRYVEGRGCLKVADPSDSARLIEGQVTLSGGGLAELQAGEQRLAAMPKGSPAWARLADDLAKGFDRLASKASIDTLVFQRAVLEGSTNGMSAAEMEKKKRGAEESERTEQTARRSAAKYRAMVSE